jgi:hypothetical protein
MCGVTGAGLVGSRASNYKHPQQVDMYLVGLEIREDFIFIGTGGRGPGLILPSFIAYVVQ